MPRKTATLTELEKMAKEYSVDKNALFRSAIKQYALQLRVIEDIKKAIDEDDVMVTKEYVKGRENSYANPAVKELPRHADSANKTAALILDIIKTLGKPTKTPDMRPYSTHPLSCIAVTGWISRRKSTQKRFPSRKCGM